MRCRLWLRDLSENVTVVVAVVVLMFWLNYLGIVLVDCDLSQRRSFV